MLQQAGEMKERRFPGSGWCDKSYRFAAPQRESGTLQVRQRGFALAIGSFDARELQDWTVCGQEMRSYSYRRAWTGSSLEARQAGKMVAMNDSVSAIRTTDVVSLTLMSAGSWLRK